MLVAVLARHGHLAAIQQEHGTFRIVRKDTDGRFYEVEAAANRPRL